MIRSCWWRVTPWQAGLMRLCAGEQAPLVQLRDVRKMNVWGLSEWMSE